MKRLTTAAAMLACLMFVGCSNEPTLDQSTMDRFEKNMLARAKSWDGVEVETTRGITTTTKKKHTLISVNFEKTDSLNYPFRAMATVRQDYTIQLENRMPQKFARMEYHGWSYDPEENLWHPDETYERKNLGPQ